MTQSVTQKTSIPEKTWRRQTDSPTWWIAFSCGSVILHLLAFWLISLYKFNSSQQRRSQSAVPIEFIEISPQKSSPVQPKPKPKPKPVSPKPSKPIVPQNSQPNVNPSAVKPPVSTNDRDAIAFDNIPTVSETTPPQPEPIPTVSETTPPQPEPTPTVSETTPPQPEPIPTVSETTPPQPEPTPTVSETIPPQPEPTPTVSETIPPQPEPTPTVSETIPPQPEPTPTVSETIPPQPEPTPTVSETIPPQPLDGEKIANAPTDALGKTPEQRRKAPQAPIQNQPTQSGGILTASWDIDPNTPIKRDIPANPPQPKENISKSFVIPASEENNVQSTDFQVYLNIDEEGYVEPLVVDESISPQQRQLYQTYVDKEFRNKKLFVPATDPDPRTGELKPRRGELFIRIKIQQGS